jgi:hypothetical protein
MTDLAKFTDEQLRAELKSRGYYVENLWTLDDVQTALDDYNQENKTDHELEPEVMFTILEEAVSSDYVKSHINGEIGDYVENSI